MHPRRQGHVLVAAGTVSDDPSTDRQPRGVVPEELPGGGVERENIALQVASQDLLCFSEIIRLLLLLVWCAICPRLWLV